MEEGKWEKGNLLSGRGKLGYDFGRGYPSDPKMKTGDRTARAGYGGLGAAGERNSYIVGGRGRGSGGRFSGGDLPQRGEYGGGEMRRSPRGYGRGVNKPKGAQRSSFFLS